jgi:septal ring factor EnvC (AmiA/AmiB activator)
MKDENKNDIDHTTSEDRGPADLSFVIDDYRKQLYEMQQYKSQCIQLENQLKGSKAIIEDFAKAIKELKNFELSQAKEIDRLNEYVQILELQKKNN